MENSWEGFLDILELDQSVRLKANFQILMDFPNGNPTKSMLLILFDQIEKIYGKKRYTILWFNNGRTLYSKIISKDSLDFLLNLWCEIAGNYLLFLPDEVDIKSTKIEDEEIFIGKCLEKYSHLILKTEDAYVVLYLSLKK
ncbi:hypothetical protein [Peribacillus sp. SCS-37]|uniref:hypothetical protein n=1 Tax=Paraperibacillus esterisolvens TaxID=3115296 RepID=UPI003906868E